MTDELNDFRQNPEALYDYLAIRLLALSKAGSAVGVNAIKL